MICRRVVLLPFGDVSGPRGFVAPAHQKVADLFIRPQRRLAAIPKADVQAGDDRAVGLKLNGFPAVADEIPTAQHLFERAKENLERPAVVIQQRDALGVDIQQIPGQPQMTVESIPLEPMVYLTAATCGLIFTITGRIVRSGRSFFFELFPSDTT